MKNARHWRGCWIYVGSNCTCGAEQQMLKNAIVWLTTAIRVVIPLAAAAQAERQRCAGLDPIAIVSASAVAFLVELLRTSE